MVSGVPILKHFRVTFGNSIVAMVINLWCHLTYSVGVAWHTVYAMLL